ncbi:MAG: hypothetical protein ACK4MF_10480 [Hyphomicrobiaceae bacterium]
MTDQLRSFRHRVPMVAFAVITAGLTGLAAKALDGEGDLASGFTTAIVEAGRGDATVAGAAVPPQVGNEAFWLDTGRKMQELKPANYAAQSSVAIGDRFELAGAGGKQTLEVYDVRSVDGLSSTYGDSSGRPQVLVSMRVVGSKTQTVRLVVDGDGPLAGLVPLGRNADRLL